MKEHVVVFDIPPKFGRAIPSFYEVHIFDVYKGNKDKIFTLLKRLGFSSIKEEMQYESIDEQLDTVSTEPKRCILAKYNVGGVNSEYSDFWEKKQLIEVTLDCLSTNHAN